MPAAMTTNRDIRRLLNARRRELLARLRGEAEGNTPFPLHRNELFLELEGIARLEAMVATTKPKPRPLRWLLLAAAVSLLILTVLVWIHPGAGEVAVSCLNDGFRIRSAGYDIRPDNLPLAGFDVVEIRDVVRALDHLDRPVPSDVSGERLYFSPGARLATLRTSGDSETTFSRLEDQRFLIEIEGDSPTTSITPNDSSMCREPPCEDRPNAWRNNLNVTFAGRRTLQVILERTASSDAESSATPRPLLRLSGDRELVAFDTMTGNLGLPTGFDSRVEEASLSFIGYGDLKRELAFGQELRLVSPKGHLAASWVPEGFRVTFTGRTADVRTISGKTYTPNALMWLWKNATFVLYVSAFGSIFGVILAWLRKIRKSDFDD